MRRDCASSQTWGNAGHAFPCLPPASRVLCHGTCPRSVSVFFLVYTRFPGLPWPALPSLVACWGLSGAGEVFSAHFRIRWPREEISCRQQLKEGLWGCAGTGHTGPVGGRLCQGQETRSERCLGDGGLRTGPGGAPVSRTLLALEIPGGTGVTTVAG